MGRRSARYVPVGPLCPSPMGMGHNGTGTQRDWDTLGLEHILDGPVIDSHNVTIDVIPRALFD